MNTGMSSSRSSGDERYIRMVDELRVECPATDGIIHWVLKIVSIPEPRQSKVLYSILRLRFPMHEKLTAALVLQELLSKSKTPDSLQDFVVQTTRTFWRDAGVALLYSAVRSAWQGEKEGDGLNMALYTAAAMYHIGKEQYQILAPAEA